MIERPLEYEPVLIREFLASQIEAVRVEAGPRTEVLGTLSEMGRRKTSLYPDGNRPRY